MLSSIDSLYLAIAPHARVAGLAERLQVMALGLADQVVRRDEALAAAQEQAL